MREIYVDSSDKLNEVCQALRSGSFVALDTEFVRERTYYAQLCLVQVAGEDLTACIDPLTLQDLGPLVELLNDRNLLKLLHAGSQDLEILLQATGQVPCPIFDTQVAATLSGHGDQISYSQLVERLLGVRLDKRHTRTDWSRRPLSDQQVRYALDDVVYLEGCYRSLQATLETRGRLDWLGEDFRELCAPHRYRSEPEDAWRRVGGLGKLNARSRAVARALAAWRERQAQQSDKPRRWLMSDDALLAIARRMPANLAKLGSLPGMDKGLVRRSGEAILEVVQVVRSVPLDESADAITQTRPDPQQEALCDILMGILRLRAAQNDIAQTTLASRRDLQQLVGGNRNLAVLRGWRRRLVGEDLLAAAEGEALVRIRGGAIDLQTDGTD